LFPTVWKPGSRNERSFHVILTFMTFLEKLKERALRVKIEVLALWYAARDPRCPWYARGMALLVSAYAFSPIDLIPDFIPVLGYLDDLILIPAGIALSIRMIPPTVMGEAREKARLEAEKPVSIAAGVVIAVVWLLILFFIGRAILRAILIKA